MNTIPTYSKLPFEGWTHRFIVELETGDPKIYSVHMYSNIDNYEKLLSFIETVKSEKVKSYKISHRASKEDDEMATKFIQ